jgi:hypothetical protein
VSDGSRVKPVHVVHHDHLRDRSSSQSTQNSGHPGLDLTHTLERGDTYSTMESV